MQNPPRVFVSHSHKDDAFTQQLVSDLHAAGAEVWVDVAGIHHGNFMQRIDEAMQRCDWLVLVLTPHAIASSYVKDEVYAALLRVKQGYMQAVIPILAAPCVPGSIPPQLDALHRYDATESYMAAVAGMLNALGLAQQVSVSSEPAALPAASALTPAPLFPAGPPPAPPNPAIPTPAPPVVPQPSAQATIIPRAATKSPSASPPALIAGPASASAPAHPRRARSASKRQVPRSLVVIGALVALAVVLASSAVTLLIHGLPPSRTSGQTPRPTATTSAPDTQVLWKATGLPGIQVAAGGIEGTPAVGSGVVIFAATGNLLICLDTGTGATRWTLQDYFTKRANPTLAGGVVYIGPGDFNHDVWAIAVKDGANIWYASTGGQVLGAPAVVNGLVYVASDDGFVYALNAADGSVRWRTRTGVGVMEGSPQVVNGTVYVAGYAGNSGWVYGLDAADGTIRLKTGVGGRVATSVAVGNGLVFAGADDSSVYAISTTDGSIRWKVATGGSIVSAPFVAGSVVYAGSDDGNIYALNVADGSQRWKTRISIANFDGVASAPVVADGALYVGSRDHAVYALNVADGSIRWRHLTGGAVYGTPAIANHVVYIGSDDSNLYALGA